MAALTQKMAAGASAEDVEKTAGGIVDRSGPSGEAPQPPLLHRLALCALPRAAWVTFMVLVIVWVMLAEGGFGFAASSLFGWHAVLMSAAFGAFPKGWSPICI